jgi:hypothetical protein
MTPDTRIAKSFNILFTDYQMLLGHEAIGLYYHLIWIHSRSLGKPVTAEYIRSKTFMTDEYLMKMLKKLGAFKLVSRIRVENENGKEWEYAIDNPKYISTQDKYNIVEKMYNKVLIDEVEKNRLFEYIKDTATNEKNDKDNTEINYLTKDKDFSEGLTEINPDTSMGLVLYYYKKLGEVFGGKYVSRNIQQESANLKDCMKKNSDTPQMTREFFDWLLNKAKTKNQFEQVASLGLYPEYRKHAYHALYVQQSGDKKFEEKASDNVSKEDKLTKNIRSVYDMYISEGMTHELAVVKLNANFSEEVVSKSLDTVNAK